MSSPLRGTGITLVLARYNSLLRMAMLFRRPLKYWRTPVLFFGSSCISGQLCFFLVSSSLWQYLLCDWQPCVVCFVCNRSLDITQCCFRIRTISLLLLYVPLSTPCAARKARSVNVSVWNVLLWDSYLFLLTLFAARKARSGIVSLWKLLLWANTSISGTSISDTDYVFSQCLRHHVRELCDSSYG